MTQTKASPATNAANAPLTGAELAIAALEAHGVDTVFGIPGVHTLALYDALGSSNIRHVLARHEQGVGFMADGYARATGRPGVACVITGPGVTNIATAIGEAYTDSSPVMVLSANVRRPLLDAMRGSLHDLKDQLGVMAAVTKWNARAMTADEVPALMREAFAQIGSGRPLPVHVEFPLDVLDEATERSAVQVARPEQLAPDAGLLAAAAQRLIRANRILIYCGGGAVSSEAGLQILAIAEALGAAIVTSVMGKGSVPEDHPRVIGNLWEAGNVVDELLHSCDCMLVIGSKLGEQWTQGFRMRFPAELIRIDVDERELTLNAHPSLSIHGDAALATEGIAGLLAGGAVQKDGISIDEIAQIKQAALKASFGYDRLPYIEALRNSLPRDGILVTDMTMMSYVACNLYPVYEPRTWMFPAGYGTLGFSLPAAIGAKIGRPDRNVVCVIGDGGYQFTMGDLATAIQEKLTLPIVIFNDSTYSAVKEAQAREREKRYMGVDLINPDYVELAKAYGIPGVRVHSPEALELAIASALAHNTPTIIDVPIEGWV